MKEQDEMRTLITKDDLRKLKETFGPKPEWDATEMLNRLVVETHHFDYDRAINVIKEVWYHWVNNKGVQGRKAAAAFYEDILHYEEIYDALKEKADSEKKNDTIQ